MGFGAAIDAGGVDVEGPGDVADGFAVADEVAGYFLLIGAHLAGSDEGHAADLHDAATVIGPAEDEGVFEPGDAAEHGQDQTASGTPWYRLKARQVTVIQRLYRIVSR